jgi:hypothetical protein
MAQQSTDVLQRTRPATAISAGKTVTNQQKRLGFRAFFSKDRA